MNNKNKNLLFENLLLSLLFGIILSYFISGSFIYSYTLENTSAQNLINRMIMILVISVVFYFVSIYRYLFSRFSFTVLFLCFIAATLLRDTDIWTQIGFCLLTVFVFWLLHEPLYEIIGHITFPKGKHASAFILFLAIFLFALIAWVGVIRYLTFRSADFDLGIFSQLFENMKRNGLQNTTIERDRLMSHFGVHVSPIFYLLIPFYLLFPSPILLQLLQAFFVALSIWPLYLICKHYALSNKLTTIVITIYTLFPALSGSCFNDFHENCVLPFLLLFLIWAFEKNNSLLIILFTVLNLSIKEDVAILVGCLALYYILVNKQRVKAIILLSVSLCYFFIAIAILNRYGEGMLGYMSNFTLHGKNGLSEILTVILLNPGYTVLQWFNLPSKLFYIFMLMIPLSFGLLTKKYFRYLLLTPFLLMNLMPDYEAVYSLGFQYHFGITVFLFYILIMNLSEVEQGRLKHWAFLSLAAVLILFIPTSAKAALKSGITYLSEHEQNQQITQALDSIPYNVSVIASPRLVPYFYQYEEIYPITSLLKTEYIIFDRRPDMMMYEDEILEKYYQEGYEQILYIENVIEIYHSIT